MKQFRADTNEDLYRRLQIAKAELGAETNTELLEKLLMEYDDGN